MTRGERAGLVLFLALALSWVLYSLTCRGGLDEMDETIDQMGVVGE